MVFFFNDTATTEIYTLSLHDALPILWVADITYVRTWEGWLYLSFVLDTYSRRAVGWSMTNHLKTELVLDAVNMAIYNRRPTPGLIHHSDRGSQYTSVEFGSRLKEALDSCLRWDRW